MGINFLLDEIKSRLDVVDVVSAYVPLKRVGRNYVGLCPFHIEKTPSFTVSPDRQMFYCFGCQVGGDVIKFIQLIEGLDFLDAVEKAAEIAGVEVDLKGFSPEEKRNRDRLKELHRVIAEAYVNFLRTEVGEKAREYLKDRGIQPLWWDVFKIGYAPSGFDLSQMLLKRGFTEQELVASGLFTKRDGRFLPKFFERIMIPICDNKGDVVAFGGRVLGEGEPKYLNSPETSIFSKGKVLYGLNQAKPYIRKADRVIVVEGYMDVISMHVAGFRETVASLGTAFTLEQAKMLSRLTKNVYLLYDGDAAGKKAAFRASKMLYAVGVEGKIVELPEGMDPDDFVKRYGADALSELLERSRSAVEIVLERMGDGSFSRKEALEEIFELLEETEDPLVIDSVLAYVSERIFVPVEDLKGALSRKKRIRHRQKEKIRSGTKVEWERDVLVAFLRDAELWQAWREKIDPSCFKDETVRSLIEKMLDRGDVKSFVDELSEEEMSLVGKALFDEAEVDVTSALELLKKRIAAKEVQKLKEKIKEAQRNKSSEYGELLRLYVEKLRNLKI